VSFRMRAPLEIISLPGGIGSFIGVPTTLFGNPIAFANRRSSGAIGDSARNGFGEPRDREPKSTLSRPRLAAETARLVFGPRKRPHFVGYSSETRKRRFASDCVVVDCSHHRTGLHENFSANREKNREFCGIRPPDAIFEPNPRAHSKACGKIPYATEQGIFLV
jgi:hypothetical protein